MKSWVVVSIPFGVGLFLLFELFTRPWILETLCRELVKC